MRWVRLMAYKENLLLLAYGKRHYGTIAIPYWKV